MHIIQLFLEMELILAFMRQLVTFLLSPFRKFSKNDIFSWAKVRDKFSIINYKHWFFFENFETPKHLKEVGLLDPDLPENNEVDLNYLMSIMLDKVKQNLNIKIYF